MSISTVKSIVKLERKAMLFNQNGKWKYDIVLKYSPEDIQETNLWKSASEALKRATQEGISLVTLEQIPDEWFMIVRNPFSIYSHPICVYGKTRFND